MPLAGKTTVAEIMKDKGFSVLDMGDVVRIEMEKRGIGTESTGEFVTSLRDEHGMDAIAQLCIPYLEEMVEESEDVVITGMRGWSEKKTFEEETGQSIEVIGVWASRKTRRERREERKREEDVKGQAFEERDIREIENGVGKLFALTDYMIENEEVSMDELKEEVKKIVE